jgi:D-beta-D-heptose 7-phosphate kinase/D-beta-D-heptose 1-phosphate adenosyltransferase
MGVGRLRQIVDAITTKNVMVIGDIMLDKYLWGTVSRISPEAPVPIVDVSEETARLGGAANVANNIATLGAGCELCAVMGEDRAGEEIVSLIEDRGIDVSGVVRDPRRPTTVKTRIIAHNQQVVRADQETRDEIDGDVRQKLTDLVMAGLARCDAVIISDYGKGVITRELLECLIPAARSQRRPVSVDPKETHFMNYRRVSLITPNQYEAGGAVGKRIQDEQGLLEVGWKIVELLDVDALLITRGELGMSLFEADGTYQHFPTVARHVYDVTGAGDTVITAFTLAMCAGASMAEAAHLANHAAGIVIRDVGTATVKPRDLIASFREEQESSEGD